MCQPGSAVSPTTILSTPSLAAELGDLVRRRHDRLDVAALDAIGEVRLGQQRGGRDDDGAELDRSEHHLPQRGDIAQRQEDAVAALDARARAASWRPGSTAAPSQRTSPWSRAPDAVSTIHSAGRSATAGSAPSAVEPVDRPVERHRVRPAEAGIGARVVLAVVQQKLPRLGERGHRRLPWRFPRCVGLKPSRWCGLFRARPALGAGHATSVRRAPPGYKRLPAGDLARKRQGAFRHPPARATARSRSALIRVCHPGPVAR